MAISFVKNAGSAFAAAVSSLTVDIITSVVPVNEHLFLCLYSSAGGGTPSASWVADTGGNSWQMDVSIRISTQQWATIFSSKITTQLAVSDDVIVTPAASADLRMGLLHFSGIAQTGWLDVTATNTQSAVTNVTITSPTLSQADEVWIFSTSGRLAGAGPWTEDNGTNVHDIISGGQGLATQYAIVSATTAITTGGNWNADSHEAASVIATYKAAGDATVSATASLPYEAQANRSSPLSLPLEARKIISNAISVPYESRQAILVTTASLPAGNVGTSYSQTLQASGGTPPYTWSIVSGSLPSGLALTAGTGEISGTPTTPGTSNFTVRATDAVSATDDQALSILIQAATSWPPPAERLLRVPYGAVGST